MYIINMIVVRGGHFWEGTLLQCNRKRDQIAPTVNTYATNLSDSVTSPSLTLPPISSLHNRLPTSHLWTSLTTIFTLPSLLPLTYFMPTASLPITASVSVRTWDPSLPQDGLSLGSQPYSFCDPPLPTLRPDWTIHRFLDMSENERSSGMKLMCFQLSALSLILSPLTNNLLSPPALSSEYL